MSESDTSNEQQARAPKPGTRRRSSTSARSRLADWLATHPPAGMSSEEVQAHVQRMPARYWERVNEEDLVWHLNTLHGFFSKLARADSLGAPITVDSTHTPDLNLSRVVVCSWDRAGLLEQVVAAFNALRINILRADVYTRTDNLVLDVFEVCESKNASARDGSLLSELSFLVEGAFSNPPRFASVWAAQFHKALPTRKGQTCQVSFDNRRSPDHTLLRVEASDRPGLLYDLLHTLKNNNLAVTQAVIDTNQDVAKDQFHLATVDGLKITDRARLGHLRREIAEAITE